MHMLERNSFRKVFLHEFGEGESRKDTLKICVNEAKTLYYMMVRVSLREKFLHIARDLVIIWFLL